MKTRTKEVKTFIIEWICECGGLMELDKDATTLFADPPKYLHTCDKCSETEYSEEQYPKAKMEYVDVEID